MANIINIDQKYKYTNNRPSLKGRGFVYITINLINKKIYIGRRAYSNDWRRYLGSGVAFKRAVKKYGKNNFKRIVLSVGYSEEELMDLEKLYISIFNSNNRDIGYNLSNGGENASGRVVTKEVRSIISQKLTGNTRSKDAIERQIETCKLQNRKVTPEHKALLSKHLQNNSRGNKRIIVTCQITGSVSEFDSIKTTAIFFGTSVNVLIRYLKGFRKRFDRGVGKIEYTPYNSHIFKNNLFQYK